MQKTVPNGSKDANSISGTPQAEPKRAQQREGAGHLAQLAAMANRNSRVQAQQTLSRDLEGSAQVEAQRNLAAGINAGAPVAAQLKRLEEKPAQTKGKLEEKKPAQRQVEPAQAKSKLDENKPKQAKFDDSAQAKRKEEKHPGQIKAKEKEKVRQCKVDADSSAQLEAAPSPNRTGLPDQLKTGVESLSGISLDDVKVHYNSDKPAQLNSLAYAQGTDIHVAPGQEKHLPHEAWHIVQQKQGRVRPTMQMQQGVPVNDDRGLEKEADVMGLRALQMKRNAEQSRRLLLETPHPAKQTNAVAGLSSGASAPAQRIGRIIVNQRAYTPEDAAQELIRSGEQGSRTYQQIVAVLKDESLPDPEMSFRSWFALGWFVERQHDRITGLAGAMAPRRLDSIRDLEQTLDYICGNKWWYAGGYAALLWLRAFGLQEVPTDDLDIAIGGEAEDKKVREYLPEALWKDHTQTVEGYSVQLIGGRGLAKMHRFGSSNVLVPEIIIQNYSKQEPPKASGKLGGSAMGLGALGGLVASAAKSKLKIAEEEQEAPENLEKKRKRELRVRLLNELIGKY